MRKWAVVLIAVFALTLAGCAAEEAASSQTNPFVERFMGKWTSEVNGVNYTLELQDGIELVGVDGSEWMSRAEFTVDEINEKESFITVSGISEDLAGLEEQGAKTEYRSKLILKENGRLLYIYDYRNRKIESEWRRKEEP